MRLFHRSKTVTRHPQEQESPTCSKSTKKSRIPLALQAVFLASNRGHEVHQPPPCKAANRTFGRRFWQRRQSQQAPSSPDHTVYNESSENTESTLGSTTPLGKYIHCMDEQDPISPWKVGVNSSTETFATPPKKTLPKLTPQSFLNALMRSRGYPVVNYQSLQSAYYNAPTDLQQASYNIHLIDLVKDHKLKELRECLDAGLSPNPCNAWGESVLHLLCRRGSTPDLLQVFLDAGADVKVVDDYGRSPLHDACWSVQPCMDTIALLLDCDVHLLQMRDCRGAQPLSYVPEAHWADWMAFLNEHKDRYFPVLRNGGKVTPPPLTQENPHSRPVVDPPNALPLELARMVASGRMSAAEVGLLLDDDDDDEDDYDEDEEARAWESRYGTSVEDDDEYTDDEDDNSSLRTNEEGSLEEVDDRKEVADETHSSRMQRTIKFGGRQYSFSGSEGDQTPIPAMDSLKGYTKASNDEDDDDDDYSSDEEDDDASFLEEVVGILGISRPQYHSSSYKSETAEQETHDDTPMPPVPSVVVDERITQNFFTAPTKCRRDSACSTNSTRPEQKCASLLVSNDPLEEDDNLLAFSC